SGCERRLCIGALEIDVARRTVRHEAELLRSVLKKIGHHGNLWTLGWWLRRCMRINRPRRARIDRWLGQNIVVEADRQMLAAFRVARTPFLRDRIPVSRGLGVIGGARDLVLR